jgi:hypothetical protein
MSKPIGYYTSHTPGDGSLFDDMTESYGAKLEQISHREKLFLISSLASQLCVEKTGDCRNEIYELSAEIMEILTPGDIEGLIAALIDQVRWDKDNGQQTLHHAGSIAVNRD